ncbi:MAG: HPF/RaiA family ribosome-associated protein [Pseudomonadota bacterium]
MNLIVRAHSLHVEADVKAFVESALESALGRFIEQLMAVDVFLSDLNGPKGGKDKQVVIRLRLQNGQVIMAETTREDLYAALVLSIRKAKRAVRRSLRKSRRFQHRPLRTLPNTLSTEI